MSAPTFDFVILTGVPPKPDRTSPAFVIVVVPTVSAVRNASRVALKFGRTMLLAVASAFRVISMSSLFFLPRRLRSNPLVRLSN
jgi:hypothetical protein